MLMMQAVAPRQSYGSTSPSRQNFTRVAALIICCSAAALVALGGIANSPEPQHASNVLAIKAQLQSQLQVERAIITAQVHYSPSDTEHLKSLGSHQRTA